MYVGKKAADALAEKMHIRGAIDLRAFAHDLVFGSGGPQTQAIRDSLSTVLGLEPGGMAVLLESMAHDEAAMRIRYYWGAVIAPSRPDEDEDEDEDGPPVDDDEPRQPLGATVQPIAAAPTQPATPSPAPPSDGASSPTLPDPRTTNGSTPTTSHDKAA
ncbi:MAG TPA: hypothetical protein VF516_00085 [Kofleriaceae bacterium]